MANPLDTPLKIVNAAYVSLVGGEAITSFTDGTAVGKAMQQAYETIVRECLAVNRWRFNMKKAQLVRLAEAPLESYAAAYAVPADCLVLHSVSKPALIAGGESTEISFDWFGDEVHCNAEATDTVIADYGWRRPESGWTPLFTEYVRYRIATELALGPARDPQLAVMLAQQAEIKRRYAGTMEAQARTAQQLDVNALRSARRR